MKAFAIFVILFLAAQAAEDFCYREVDRACKQTGSKQDSPKIATCDAKYGAIEAVQGDLQNYVNSHIQRSFEYLMMSTHYANYEKNREGFEKLFRGLSDEKWNDAIELIKYLAKRGGEMHIVGARVESKANDFELYELESLAKALDTEKELAKQAHLIHGEATRRRKEYHDPEISSFIEEEFVHKHADCIRKLSGYTHDVMKILDGPDRSLGLYFFDEYLQKQ